MDAPEATHEGGAIMAKKTMQSEPVDMDVPVPHLTVLRQELGANGEPRVITRDRVKMQPLEGVVTVPKGTRYTVIHHILREDATVASLPRNSREIITFEVEATHVGTRRYALKDRLHVRTEINGQEYWLAVAHPSEVKKYAASTERFFGASA